MNTKLFVGGLSVILLLGGVYFIYSNTKSGGTPDAGQDQGACTMDALLCPDGTGVGREGPSCVFAACPNAPEWVGELSQQGGEFRLIIASPEGSNGATYALPLEFRISNAVRDLVGRQVRVKGTFAEGNTLKVETMEPAAAENPAAGVNIGTLKIGETKLIGRIKVTLNGVSQDSRCPANVQCVWAGEVVANVSLLSDTDRETVDMRSSKAPHPFDSSKISIVAVAPAKLGVQNIDPRSYSITFKVEPL